VFRRMSGSWRRRSICSTNYAAFQLRAWCDRLELVPSARDLLVVEPSVQAEEPELTKRALSYPISIKVSPGLGDD
jgi:hypothetical protein